MGVPVVTSSSCAINGFVLKHLVLSSVQKLHNHGMN
uniref:Uncharacterized protein n=1 Tax=Anguilla anguilla TaxID=7936 RepID=A0A0E9T5Z8_ANGAN